MRTNARPCSHLAEPARINFGLLRAARVCRWPTEGEEDGFKKNWNDGGRIKMTQTSGSTHTHIQHLHAKMHNCHEGGMLIDKS